MKAIVCLGCLFITLKPLFAQEKISSCPSEIIEKTIHALGGKNRLKEIQNLRLEGYGYRSLLEQSERFEGPFIPANFDFQVVLDFKDTLELYSRKEQDFTFQVNSSYLVNKETVAMRSKGSIVPCPQDQTIQDDLYLNPLKVFDKALESPSLMCLRDTLIQTQLNKRIKFLWNQYPVTLSVNPYTYLPTCIEIEKPYNDNFLGVWGDLKKVVHYSFWDLLENGIHYPRQKDIFFQDKLWESTVIINMELNTPLSVDSLRIPTDVEKAAHNFDQETTARIQKMMNSKTELIKGAWLIPGICNATIIKQGDGLVIIEAPNTSSNMDQVIDEAKKLFPGTTIKCIVTTSDAWLHCGGVRSAVGHSRLVALKANEGIIQALLRANFITHPDAWQKARNKKTSIQYIDKRTVLGSGSNRIELIPLRTEAGERMMIAYFPEHKLLYASDILQPGNWQKHYTLELIQAVEREKLDVVTVYAMHMKPVKYQSILDSMQTYLK